MMPLYMKQGGLLEHKAIVTKVGTSEINKKQYHWIQLDETIFHPKGGGQPSDEGTIEGKAVAYVHKEISEILHCFEENPHFNEGDAVLLKVDPVKRKLHSRLHTAGHLVAEAVNKNFPELEAYQGNHYPDNCFVRFKNTGNTYEKEEIKRRVEAEIQSWIESDLPIFTMLSEGIRTIKITQGWSRCGGTHLESLKELGRVEIADVSINHKEGTITVKYALT
jgi:alanyl-tRNA synthetase